MSNNSQSQSQKKSNNTIEIKTNSDGISSNESIKSAFNNTMKNLDNLKELKVILDLKSDLSVIKNAKKPLGEYMEENEKIAEIYKNEDIMLDKIKEENSPFKLDDFIFEERVTKIFSDVYNLKECLLYPYFDVKIAEKKRTNVITVSFNRISFYTEEKTNSSPIKSPPVLMYVLDDRKTFIATFQKIPMIFTKEDEIFKSVSVLADTYDYSSEFQIKKDGNEYIATIPLIEIKKDLIDLERRINQTKNIISSTDDKQEKLKAEKDLKKYEEQHRSLKKKYSRSNIITKIKNVKNELSQLEMEKNLSDEQKQKKQNLSAEIKELEELYKISLKSIIIKIQKKNQEFDSLFFSTKEIELKNSIGDTLTIPPKKPIIVEVKNNTNYGKIIKNIKDKKRLLTAINLDEKSFYYVGIMRGINIDPIRTKKVNENSGNKPSDKKSDNIIVIYPDNGLNFLGNPLIEIEKEKKSQEKIIEESQGDNIQKEEKKESNNIENLLKEMQEELKELKTIVNDLRKDVNILKKDVNILKDDVGEIKQNF